MIRGCYQWCLLLWACVLVGCGRQPLTERMMPPTHDAQGFAMTDYDGYTHVVVYSPFDAGAVQAEYCLAEDVSLVPDSMRAGCVVVHTPVNRLAATSCTHVGVLGEIDALDALCGVTDPHLIYNAHVREAVSAGTVANLGSSIQVDAESVVGCQAEVVLLSSYSTSDPNVAILEKLGIPVVYDNEWTEQSPLGRAEWMRLVGALVGRRHEADSIYAVVRERYENLCEAHSADMASRPSILSGGSFRGTWYVPTGRTYMGRLFHDAGANYYYENDTTARSLPLSMETVLQNLGTADVWVGAPANTMAELLQIDEKHAWLNAYRTGRVYSFDKRTLASGANDFWESGVVHPERILQDLIYVLQDEQPSDSVLYYIHHLE